MSSVFEETSNGTWRYDNVIGRPLKLKCKPAYATEEAVALNYMQNITTQPQSYQNIIYSLIRQSHFGC